MRILVLGGGGREHAIVRSLASSPSVTQILAAPGNAGTSLVPGATNIAVDAENPSAVVELAGENDIDLVVVGPEAPLVAGVADAVRAVGIACFGPGAAGARVEGSKAFAKELMGRAGVPTAASQVFRDRAAALAYLEGVGAPIVVKADGLAAGKGVTVALDVDVARAAVNECFDGRFGTAGSTLVIEEYLEGPECSMLAFVDSDSVVPMVASQDHKRAHDDDKGPNTGGMGAYSPVPVVSDAEHARMVEIMERTAAQLRSDGIDYRGVLYGGFILTGAGPKVLEFNVRFGDPETQVVLPLMDADLGEVMLAVAENRLSSAQIAWSEDAAVTVVIASGGYPGSYETGKVISGLDAAEAVEGVAVYHAGTSRRDDGEVVTSGGRVLDVTAVAPDIRSARARAYEAAQAITFDGAFYRTDIGLKALSGPLSGCGG